MRIYCDPHISVKKESDEKLAAHKSAYIAVKPYLLVTAGDAQWDRDPAVRLGDALRVNLFQVVHRRSAADGDLLGRVTLVQLVVEVECHLLQRHLLVELNVDQVRLAAV